MSLYSNSNTQLGGKSKSPIYMTESEAKKLYESLNRIEVVKESAGYPNIVKSQIKSLLYSKNEVSKNDIENIRKKLLSANNGALVSTYLLICLSVFSFTNITGITDVNPKVAAAFLGGTGIFWALIGKLNSNDIKDDEKFKARIKQVKENIAEDNSIKNESEFSYNKRLIEVCDKILAIMDKKSNNEETETKTESVSFLEFVNDISC